MIWFKVDKYYGNNIEAVELNRVTSKSVFFTVAVFCFSGDPVIEEKKELKWTDNHEWFDNFDDAKAVAIEHLEAQVNRVRLKLNVVTGRLGNVKGYNEKLCISNLKGPIK